jgi:hypothetical protein
LRLINYNPFGHLDKIDGIYFDQIFHSNLKIVARIEHFPF